ncbi:hypothetical protein OTB20_37765 [Streptomyces sp. H27-H1]|uniref:hypothetical protein n=1 Tax=Streptomyces sp. H27-H1 TaxID=2996461 RepID=UPI002270B8FC|nr:hypothetical protein [Streptomyces sp. H27-H1]MCY0931831.1 hypothetical protein [Streptomyces sp. H27-H1]
MALGACGHRPALGLIRELAQRPFEATMVYAALGDTIIRLSTPDETAHSLRWCLETNIPMLAGGALRAVAVRRPLLDAVRREAASGSSTTVGWTAPARSRGARCRATERGVRPEERL